MVISSLIWFVFVIMIAYLIVIGIITYGWFSTSNHELEQDYNREKTGISVVIAVRNESENIELLLKRLGNQNYDRNYFDIIIIDDHSIDNTVEKINNFKRGNKELKINLITASGEGKKNALKEGIATSLSELIVTTDGDCIIKPNWLASISQYYSSSGCSLIIGPVVYTNEQTLLQKFFSLDFASLVASGAGSAGSKLPLMGNGANLAFNREVYNNLKTASFSEKYVSGDDVFLIHNITRKYGAEAIGFLRNKDAIVTTLPPHTIGDFFHQRTRWASKAVGYRLIWPVIVSITVFLFNLLLFLMLAGSLFYSWLLPFYFLVILTKLVIDLPIVTSFLSFAGKSNLKPLIFIFEVVYPVYIVIAALTSFTTTFEWKGRKKLS